MRKSIKPRFLSRQQMIRPTLDYTEIGTSGISTKKIPEQSVVTLTEMMMMTREGT